MSAGARLGVVVVLLAAGAGVGQLTTAPLPPAPPATQVPVVRAAAVCPDLRQEGERGATAVTAGTTVPGGGRTTGGPLREPATPLPTAPVVRDLGREVAGGAFVLQAEGAVAAGLVAEQATRATAGSRRGLAALSCPAPATSSWFVGGSTVVGAATELLLVNVATTPATVDLAVWTATGRADPRPGRGVVVPAQRRIAVPLDRLAPDRDLLAVHVDATRGQVAAALRVVRTDGRVPLGTDWVPPGEAPSTDLVVPGLPEGPGRRTLLVTNPGDQAAVAQVELTTADGQLPLDDLPVAAGTTVALDLSEQLAQTPAAVRVRSDLPLLAGAEVVDRQDGPVRERSYAAAVPALTGPVLLADVRLSPPTEVTLLLSALVQDAVVEVAPVAAPGELPAPLRVEVPQGTTVPVRLSRFLPPGSTGSLAVLVRPASGQVHAARYARERGRTGPLTTLLPLRTPPAGVPLPAVVPEP